MTQLFSATRRFLLATCFVSLTATSGCFSDPEPECAFACGENSACPDGYRCAGDGWCKRDDVAEDFSCSAVSLIDGSTADSSQIDGDTPVVDAGVDAEAVIDADIDAEPEIDADIDAAPEVDADIDAAPVDADVDAAVDIDAAVDADVDAAPVDADIDAAP